MNSNWTPHIPTLTRVSLTITCVAAVIALTSLRPATTSKAQSVTVSAQDIQRWSRPNSGPIITIFGDGNILSSGCQSCPSQIISHRTGTTINPNYPGVAGVAFARPSIRLSNSEQDLILGGWESQWGFRKDGTQKWVIPVGCCNSASQPWALDAATNRAYMVGGVLNGMGQIDMSSGMYNNPGPFTFPNFAWSAEPVFVSMADSNNFYLAARTGWVARLYPFNTTQWQITIDPNAMLQPGAVAADGSFVVTSGAPHLNAESFAPQPGRLARILSDGSVVFNNFVNAVTPPVIGGNGLIFVGSQAAPIDANGMAAIAAYDLDGNQVWSTQVQGLPNDLLVGDDGAVYAGTGALNNGNVYILDQNTGAIRKTITNVPGAWEMMLRGGTLYTAGSAITALNVDAVNYDPQSPWPLRFHENQRTSNRQSLIPSPPREPSPISCEGLEWLQWPAADGGNDHFYANAGPFLNWHDAENAAEARGATLVTITSQAERDFVVSTLLSDRNVYWLGGTDEASEGTFTWVTGEPFVYTDWVGGEPNNYGGAENYIAANWHVARDGFNSGQGIGNFGRWNDVTLNGSDAATGPVGPYFALFERNTAPLCDATAPVTTAAQNSAANAAGWNNSDVTVNLAAADEANGSGVKEITFSATGAQSIPSTTVHGAMASFNITGEGLTSITYFARDNAGNAETAHSLTIRLDKHSPNTSCGPADGLWHGVDVSIACTANDAVSGLSGASDASFSLSTNVPAGTETANASTSSRSVCDAADNCATAGPINGNKIDKKAPTITITSPNASNYVLNQAVTVHFSCADGGSGVANCTGSSLNGGPLNTSSAGVHTFVANANDNVGNTAIQVSVDYTVDYNVVALFDQTKAAKSGSTIPIKVRLVDANGVNVSSSALTVHAVSVLQISSQSSSALQDAGNANPDFDFRYDASLGGYIFNLKTTGYGTGLYLLIFTGANSSTPYSLGFQVRQ